MKRLIYFLCLFFIATLFCCCNKKADIKILLEYDGQMSIEHAHPNAQKLLVDDFYWNSMAETGPLGNDTGSDAFYGYRAWRRSNLTKSPVEYLNKFYARMSLQLLDLNELRDSVILEYIDSDNINGNVLVDTDNAAISIGFGQFMLEGKIDQDIKALTKRAITRERKPILLREFAQGHIATREKQLEEMALILEMMETNP